MPAPCEICNQDVTEPTGYILSSAQVTGEQEYWKFLFQNLSGAKEILGAHGEKLGKYIVFACSHRSGWLVCDTCIQIFSPDPLRSHAFPSVKWLHGRPTFHRELGPAPLAPACDAAKMGWKLTYGTLPNVVLNENDPELHKAILDYSECDLVWKLAEIEWWQFWRRHEAFEIRHRLRIQVGRTRLLALRTDIRNNDDQASCLSCKRTVKVNFSSIEKKIEHRQSTELLLGKHGNRRGGLFLFHLLDGTVCIRCRGIVCGTCSETAGSCPICGQELHWIGELLSNEIGAEWHVLRNSLASVSPH